MAAGSDSSGTVKGKECWMRWKQTYGSGRGQLKHDPWFLMSLHTQILCSFVVKHATLSGMYLWVEEWARVEELWDLEDCRLPGKGASSPCLMTLSVAGTFLEIYCHWERRKETLIYWQKTLHHNKFHLLRRVTYIYHGYLLRTRSWVIGSVGQVAVGVIHINVLPQMIVHLLPLFPGGEATVRQCHSLRHRPRVTIITLQFKKSFYHLEVFLPYIQFGYLLYNDPQKSIQTRKSHLKLQFH